MTKSGARFFPHRRLVSVLLHGGLVIVSYFLAFLLRFDFDLPAKYWIRFLQTIPLLMVTRLAIFAVFHMYEDLWRYVGVGDVLRMLRAVTLSSLIFLGGEFVIFGHGFPRSVFLLDWILCLSLVAGVRVVLRAIRESPFRFQQGEKRKTLVVGAGDAGEMLIREINRNRRLTYEVVGFVDDDRRKHRRRIHGVEVVGTVDQLVELSREKGIEEILIAVPSATREQRRRIVEVCRRCRIPFKTVPDTKQLLEGRARISQLQEVRPEDVLGRESLRLGVEGLQRQLQGKCILVTGAGGSIGSELCRQLAVLGPERLVLFDRSESSLYFADAELRRRHPGLQILPVVGDIVDREKVREVIQVSAPEIVYHAAAYKHVPLMEQYPLEAIQNNVFGTEIVAEAARLGGVKKFVLISTDKAVEPVGIMGMTKRVAESLVRSFTGGETMFMAVRFGNVLGSEGSVLPLFQWQIMQGGPVTVTDPEASRYFMLLSEAALLVLHAGIMGKGGEVFFLDMGEPVKIVDLARNLVRLSGLEVGEDIQIEMTGLRPGERLNEALIMEGEKLLPTGHEKVFMLEGHFTDPAAFREDLEELRGLVVARKRDEAVAQLKAMAARY